MKPADIDEFFRRLAADNPAPKTELEYINPYTLLVAVVCLVVLYIHLAPVARRRSARIARRCCRTSTRGGRSSSTPS